MAQHLLVAGLPGAPDADLFQIAELLHIGLLAVDADILELVELGIGLLAEQLLVLLGDGVAGGAQQVHAGHAVVAHGGVQGVIQSLRVHGHALDLVLDEPLAGVNAGAGGVMIVGLGVVEQAVHTGVQTHDLALQISLVDAVLLAGGVQVLVGDEAPGLDVDLQDDGGAGVGVDGHLVGVAGAAAVELILHHVTGSVAVGAGVHGAGDALGQNAALGHGVGTDDVGLVEVGPAGDLSAEGVSQVNKNGLSHDDYLQIKIVVYLISLRRRCRRRGTDWSCGIAAGERIRTSSAWRYSRSNTRAGRCWRPRSAPGSTPASPCRS